MPYFNNDGSYNRNGGQWGNQNNQNNQGGQYGSQFYNREPVNRGNCQQVNHIGGGFAQTNHNTIFRNGNSIFVQGNGRGQQDYGNTIGNCTQTNHGTIVKQGRNMWLANGRTYTLMNGFLMDGHGNSWNGVREEDVPGIIMGQMMR